MFLLCFVGVITGVGGGVLRDVLAGNMPYVFVKHIYACASLAGALVCIWFWPISHVLAMMLGAGSVVFDSQFVSALSLESAKGSDGIGLKRK